MSLATNFVRVLTPKNMAATMITANMICRPTITMSNKQVPEETRKYTASREFCTEFFGLANNLVFVTFLENLGGQIAAKKETGQFLNKDNLRKIKKSVMSGLNPQEQKIKTGILLASFLGTAASAAFFTPLLNNFVLNKFLDKIIKNKNNKEENIFSKHYKLT